MTQKEVFFKFCKMNNLLPLIYRKYYFSDYKAKEFFTVNGISGPTTLSLGEYYKIRARFGMLDLFYEFFAKLLNFNLWYNEQFKKGSKKWNYFVRNNVFLQNLKIGDKISHERGAFFGAIEGVVQEINYRYHYVLISFEEMGQQRTYRISFQNIRKVNGEDFTPDYYIKYKRKTYGLNKG